MTRRMTEKDFQAAVMDFARLNGWLVYHPPANRPGGKTGRVQRVEPGFPDLTMVRDGHLLFAELKRDGAYLRAEQRAWCHALEHVANRTPWVSVWLWRPSDWPEIEAVLARRHNDEERQAA